MDLQSPPDASSHSDKRSGNGEEMIELVISSDFNSEGVEPGTAVISKDTNVDITPLVNFLRNKLTYFRCNCPCTHTVPISHQLEGAVINVKVFIMAALQASEKLRLKDE
jgi:hypothetical protein